MCMWVYIYMCVLKKRETENHSIDFIVHEIKRERQRGRETHRERETQRERESVCVCLYVVSCGVVVLC